MGDVSRLIASNLIYNSHSASAPKDLNIFQNLYYVMIPAFAVFCA
jgi:hypothetical protein